jgi:uncharacterized membrane protein
MPTNDGFPPFEGAIDLNKELFMTLYALSGVFFGYSYYRILAYKKHLYNVHDKLSNSPWMRSNTDDSEQTQVYDEALRVLKIRLANGEIDKDEFNELRKLIES